MAAKSDKKLKQPQLSNFFQNSKVHVSSVVTNDNDKSVENDENSPTGISLEPYSENVTEGTPSVKKFMKVPPPPSGTQTLPKKRKLSAESSPQQSGKTPKTPKILETVECDPEVSSSSETVESHFKSSGSPTLKPPSKSTLDRFLQTTQQAEVSTSGAAEPDSSVETRIENEIVVKAVEKVDDKSGGVGTATDKDSGLSSDAAEESSQESTSDGANADPKARSLGDENLSKGEAMDVDENCDETEKAPSTPKTVNPKPKTPKQRAKDDERKKKAEEREKQKREREAEKAKLKMEKDKEKEEKLKAKQLEKEKAEREKEEARKKREEEKRKKDEERKKKTEELEAEKAKKEAEKRVKDEERRIKEEEKMKREEVKRLAEEEREREEREKILIKEKQAKNFANFFTKKTKEEKDEATDGDATFGIPFQIRENMALAPILRKPKEEIDVAALDIAVGREASSIVTSDEEERSTSLPPSPSRLYLGGWAARRKEKRPRKGFRTKVPGSTTTEAVHVGKVLKDFDPKADSDEPICCKAKLLQFRENYRPAFFGTFRKTSRIIKPRNPFKMDSNLLDYDVDSDEEWEEEEPGEDLEKQSDGEEEGEEEVEEQEDPFFVPHGYLSDGEGAESAEESSDEEEDGTEEQDTEERKKRKENEKLKIPENKLDPAQRKAQQEVKAKAFEVERKTRKITRLIKRCIGILWTSLPAEGDAECVDAYDKEVAKRNNAGPGELNHLNSYRSVLMASNPWPIPTSFNDVPSDQSKADSEEAESTKTAAGKANSSSLKIRAVPEEALPDLIRLVHGSSVGVANMIKEFRAFWSQKTSASSKNNDADVKTDDEACPSASDPATPLNQSSENKISNRQLDLTIKGMADYKETMWIVKEEILKKHDLHHLPIPHEWTFVTMTVDGRRGKHRNSLPDSSETTTKTPTSSATAPSSKTPQQRNKEAKTPQRTLLSFFNKASAASPPGDAESANSDSAEPTSDGVQTSETPSMKNDVDDANSAASSRSECSNDAPMDTDDGV